MQTDDKIIAIFFSDPHLSLTPPPLRSAEPDWFAAMQRPFDEIKAIQKIHKCPIFCAGDVFNRWNSPPELINWAIEHLPKGIHCIAGQHDLPEHDLSQLKRSAYYTLIEADTITNIESRLGNIFTNKDIVLQGFSFGKKCKPTQSEGDRRIYITLIHEYNWIPGIAHSGPITGKQRVGPHRKEFKGYDIVFSGDNHIPFTFWSYPETHFVNCGSLMRRKSNDLEWHPSIWLLHKDGKVQRYKLDVSKDKYLDIEDAKNIEKRALNNAINIKHLIRQLGKLGQDVLDVRDTFERAFENETTQRKRILLKAMGT